MTKKQNSRKKISLKLSQGETAIVIDYATALHIAETYDYLANQEQDEHSDSFRMVADLVRTQAAQNYFDDFSDGYEEW